MCAGAFALVVLGTSLPVSELLSQHDQLASTARQVSRLEAQNEALNAQTKELSEPSTVAGIARREYGLVSPGSKVYEILPASTAPSATAQSSGYIPLAGPPVVPGSALSQQLLGADTGGAQGAGTGTGSGAAGGSTQTGSSTLSADRAVTKRPAAGSGARSEGFWTRVVHTLEFWG
jgi:Septum formation initiator